MDFMKDIELYNQAMQNAYDLITKRKTIDEIFYELDEELIDEFPLPFNPTLEDGRTEDVIDIVISHFTETEEYEKCAELVKIKNKCLNLKI